MAGRPVIAGVYVEDPKLAAAGAQVDHAVVVEGIHQTMDGTLRLTIYDPAGFVFWQPLSTFSRFFTGEFVKPI
jgi:hypothetical protein